MVQPQEDTNIVREFSESEYRRIRSRALFLKVNKLADFSLDVYASRG